MSLFYLPTSRDCDYFDNLVIIDKWMEFMTYFCCFLGTHFQPLLSFSESLLVQLKSRMAAWEDRHTRMGDIFTHMVCSGS